ncbi:MAG: acyl-ACP--UDP-N-acetylglucosamine O-acyltransferase [Kiritimatiellae bacterium]|nr:acyl-ACP--UDP-N-acetylglucosamine O-acyltransferase [Kiritimatiellia bacterium]
MAPDVVVGPYAIISAGVTLGAGCVVGPHVVIHPYVTIGERCALHAGAVIGDTPQDLSFKEVPSFVEIGNQCILREGVTIHRGTKENTSTRVGDHCLLMANSHLAHNVELADHVILANGVMLAGYVTVGERVFIGGGAGLHQFIRVGRLAMIGGLSGLSQDVPPFCTTSSVTYNELAGLNTVGLKRAGFSPEVRTEIKRAFKCYFRSGLSRAAAEAQLEAAGPSDPVRELITFVRESKRGVCSARSADPS